MHCVLCEAKRVPLTLTPFLDKWVRSPFLSSGSLVKFLGIAIVAIARRAFALQPFGHPTAGIAEAPRRAQGFTLVFLN
jgi:hypothetical protein